MIASPGHKIDRGADIKKALRTKVAAVRLGLSVLLYL